MSHELRTPLNAIIGFAEVMETEVMGPLGVPRYRDYARDIKNSGVHLLEIINDILDLSKIEAGKVQMQEDTVALKRVVQACLTLIDERARLAHVSLTSDVADDLPPIRADERKLKQILLNLLSNSVKFTPAGGSVAVSARVLSSSEIEIAVADTGIGMSEADIPKALTPFTQIDNSLSRKFGGTGLGLPLTDSFVRLHGGKMSITSELGRGTIVTVTLPGNRVVSAVA
jgi:signal transduction histidine kinase